MATYKRTNLVPPRIDLSSPVLDSDEWLKSGEWAVVKSSNVHAIRYDYPHRWLLVEFGGKPAKGGGTTSQDVYIYYGVPPEVAKRMFESHSMGKFVHQVLKKDRYRFARLS